MSVSKENFVKTIFQLREDARESPVSGKLASELNISAAAITDMGKKLAREGLVIYKKYEPLQLTEQGKSLAISIIRRHRIWESFLYDILKIPLEHLHTEAENLEHQTSDYLLEQLEKFLNYPDFDPHGDPIPDKQGRFPKHKNELPLPEAEPNKTYLIVRVYIKDVDLLAYLEENNISVNQEITVIKKLLSEDAVIIQVNQRQLMLPAGVSKCLFIKHSPRGKHQKAR